MLRESKLKFKNSLNLKATYHDPCLLGRLSELKISVLRLANEVKKTIRKVNALEKIAIPDLQETVHFIESRLEENERDMFILMKMVKGNLESKRQKTMENNRE